MFPKYDLSYLSSFAKQAELLQKSFQATLGPVIENIQKSFHDLPPQMREALLLLGGNGWYFDLRMPISGLWTLKTAFTDGDAKKTEDALVEYFESRTEEIEESIVKKFPHRAHLIKSAFNVHRRQEYELSIPVLLAQTDGICKEVVNQYLFIKDHKKPCTAIYVEQIASETFRAALLSPLAQTLPIGASKDERSQGFDALNRHMVLHGESLDYGSKTNSLKAISLLNYVAHALTIMKENS